jgi:uncharacterized protein YxjI
MGCKESIPIALEFDQPHTTGNALAWGKYDEVCKSDAKTQLIFGAKFFSWGGDYFKIKQRNGEDFGNLRIKIKAFSFRDQLVLENTITKEPIAICLRKFAVFGSSTFKIYATTPNFTGQTPSEREYNGSRLYTFAEVVCIKLRLEQVFLEKSNKKHNDQQNGHQRVPDYVIQRVGSSRPAKRVVYYQNRPAAFMDGGKWDRRRDSYLLTICPGIDPCLIICLCAICDEFDGNDD